MPEPKTHLEAREYDAVLAGLRLLSAQLRGGHVAPDDGDIGSILTADGDHFGLTADQIDDMGDAMQFGRHQIARSEFNGKEPGR
jgi:hypothetical protein